MSITSVLAKALAAKDGKTGLMVRALDDGEAEIVVYDAIGYWGIDSASFRDELNNIGADVIHLRLDCPGGDVFMARAMKTALEQHPARVIAHIDGLAASAASYLMIGADEIEIAQGANIMIHNAWGLTIGDKREHQKGADLLVKIDGNIRADYAKKTGKPEADFESMMNDETWFDADEALDMGLVDRVYEKDGGVENRFDLSIFDKVPERLQPPAQPDDDDLNFEAARAKANWALLDFFERTAA